MLNCDLLTSIKEIDGIRDAAPYLLYRIYDEKLMTEVSPGGIDTNSIATKKASDVLRSSQKKKEVENDLFSGFVPRTNKSCNRFGDSLKYM